MRSVVIAGAGRSGLHAARMLAAAGVEVTVVERLPEPGGQEPERDARSLAKAATRAGARLVCGTLAAEFDDAGVRILGVDGTAVLPAQALVLATGSRPSTRAELGIQGDRGAGLLPGPVAHHYLDSGVLPGRHPLVVGDGQLAEHLCHQLRRAGAVEICSVRSTTVTADWPVTRTVAPARLLSVHGFPRLTSAVVSREGENVRIQTDAVLLASGRVPMRNVEGAVLPGPRVVDCFSSADPKSDQDATSTAEVATRRVLDLLR